MAVKIYENFIEESDRLYFLNEIENNFSKFSLNSMGPNRQYLKIDGTDLFKETHKKYFEKISNILKIKNIEIDPLLGILYSVIKPGGFIHKHLDSQSIYQSGNFVNYRFNLLLQRGDESGYDPIINGIKYPVKQGQAWSFPASLYEHETEIISGLKNRIVLQYGFLLNKIEYENLFLKEDELILTKKMKEYYAKNTRNGIARSREDFFSQRAEILPRI